jgi:hypothetical protein
MHRKNFATPRDENSGSFLPSFSPRDEVSGSFLLSIQLRTLSTLKLGLHLYAQEEFHFQL